MTPAELFVRYKYPDARADLKPDGWRIINGPWPHPEFGKPKLYASLRLAWEAAERRIHQSRNIAETMATENVERRTESGLPPLTTKHGPRTFAARFVDDDLLAVEALMAQHPGESFAQIVRMLIHKVI